MVFEWIDDLWIAPTSGGEARRVEENPAREEGPLFSSDGKRLVFSSDRTGSMQVFSISISGGEATQHSWHTQGCELECLSPDGTRAIIRGLRERAGMRESRLAVIDLTKESREQRLFDAAANEAAWAPDGKRVLFSTGGEQLYRKGYRGSRAAQIWEYEISTAAFVCKVAGKTESRSPVWHADGKGFYFLSGEKGSLNLMSQRDGSDTPEALTEESGESVFSRLPSADGSVFIVRRGFELFRLNPGKNRKLYPICLWTREKLPDVSRVRKTVSTTVHADFTAALDHIVFSAAGDLWWMQTAGGEAHRLTETAAAESEPCFSPDGEWLYFLRDDGLNPNYFRARLVDGSLRDEQLVTRGTLSKSRLKPSPDGRKIAWIEGNGDIFTAAADGAGPQKIHDGWDFPSFDWSPNTRWLVFAASDKNSNRDIWLGDATGKQATLNLTRHPAFEGSPKFSPDGRSIVFTAKRDADGKTRLWKMDFVTDDFKGAEFSRLADAARSIPTGDVEPMRVIWAADGKSILFQNQKSADSSLHAVELATGAMRTLTQQRGVPLRFAADGSLLWRTDLTPAIFKDGTTKKFPFSISSDQTRGEVLTLAFRRIWRTLGERFYDPKMNGSDWQALRLKYEPAAAISRTSRQFDRTVSHLLGELNASHLSFLRKPWPEEMQARKKGEETAHPGVMFRDGLVDGPLVISRVIAGSPISQVADAPQPGEVIVRIAGEAVTAHSPLHRFFNTGPGCSLPVVVRAVDGKERVAELRGISYKRARWLDRQQREAAARERVTQVGNFSYVKVRDMNMESFAALELEVYRASLQTNGMILDFRDNSGGREADRMLALFCQPEHSFTVPRDGSQGYPQSRRVHAAWDKRLVVLCDENTFSNAEIFCHAMRRIGRAKLVGVTTAGGVISAVKTVIPEVGELQIPFRGWFQTETGMNLDLNGAEPHFRVELTPGDEACGRDPQLEKALEVLIRGDR